MKRLLKRVLLYGFLLALVAALLGTLYQEELKEKLERSLKHWGTHIVQTAIQNYGPGLPPVDEVKVMLLSTEDPGTGLGSYDIRQDSPHTRYVTQEVLLKGAEALALAALWRKQKLHTHYMASCFDPHHVIQFRAKGSIVADVVICFGCGNASLPAFPLRPLVSFEYIPGKESPDYLELQAQVEQRVGTAAP